MPLPNNNFKQDFQKLSIEEQATQFSEHVRSLQLQVDNLEDESQERQGILFVLQFLQELEPRIRAGDIPMNETIIVKVMEQPPLNKLISDLKIN